MGSGLFIPHKLGASTTIQQARSCLYASTQLNPHYFDKKKIFLEKKMWFDIQPRSPDLLISWNKQK